MVSEEDEIVNALIREARINYTHPEIYPEQHYQHFGWRGIADLFVDSLVWDEVYEIKSDFAVKSASGANEIIRQASKMSKYFFKDDFHDISGLTVYYYLIFELSERTLNHLVKNVYMYAEWAGKEEVPDEVAMNESLSVLVASARGEELYKLPLFGPNYDFRKEGVYDGRDFPEQFEEIFGQHHPNLVSTAEDLFEQYSVEDEALPPRFHEDE